MTRIINIKNRETKESTITAKVYQTLVEATFKNLKMSMSSKMHTEIEYMLLYIKKKKKRIACKRCEHRWDSNVWTAATTAQNV